MPSEEPERPCTPRKRLIAAQQEDRDVAMRMTTLELSSPTSNNSNSNQPSARSGGKLVREFSAEYVQRVLETAVTTPRPS
ncbi:hypothetical protein Gpo141_00000046 [Globisporangium polare]